MLRRSRCIQIFLLSTRCSNYLEGYWPCASGLSAVNAIGTQLRDPINSGLTRWCVVVKIYGRRRGHGKKSTRFSLSVENEQADTKRDGQTCLAKLNSQAQTGTKKFSPVQLTMNRIGKLTRLICTLLLYDGMTTHAYIYIYIL